MKDPSVNKPEQTGMTTVRQGMAAVQRALMDPNARRAEDEEGIK